MIKVFLAENDSDVRSIFLNSVDWAAEECEFAGDAEDGEKAYTRIREEKPDILFADIELPLINGFELGRLVRKSLPAVKIILIGREEKIEYIRQAIRIGASDYLQKPVSPESLLDSLDMLRDAATEEKERQNLRKRLEKNVSDNAAFKKMYLLNDLLRDGISPESADRKAEKLGIHLGKGVYRFLIFKVRRREGEYTDRDTADRINDRLEYVVESIFGEGTLRFRNGSERWVFLLKAETADELSEKTRRLKNRLREMMEAYPTMDYFGGGGIPVEEIHNLKKAFETAEEVFARRFAEEPNQILIKDEAEQHEDEALDTGNLDKLEQSRILIENFLVKGSQEELDSFLDFYFSEIPEDNFRSFLIRQYMSVDIFIAINAFYKKNGIDRKREKYARIFSDRIRDVHSAEQMREVLGQVLSDTLKRRDEISGSKYVQLIETAEKYVAENYMSENISLNSVAESVNMNPSYFSSVFRKEKGITFVEYLTRVRMERAKELLVCSSMKISEIAYRVGYNDPQYFSYLFRKYNQCSPKDYRRAREGGTFG